MPTNSQSQWFGGPKADLGDPINQSLRFNSNGYLTRAQSGSGSDLISSARTFTFSTWFKHGDMGETQIFGIHPTNNNENWLLAWTSGASYDRFLGRDTAQSWVNYDSARRYRDPNAWYHLFLTCSSGVLTCYVNGVQQNQQMTQNHSMAQNFYIGSEGGGSSAMDGYLAETYFIQDSVLDAVDDGFIRLNENGVYVPSTPTISSYGTQGFHLTYDPSQDSDPLVGIGRDSSGNGNHFTALGFVTAPNVTSNRLIDIDIKDTPTSNYSVFNPLWRQTTPSVKGGNMELTTAQQITGQSTFRFPVGTTGKYWVEVGTASYGATTNPAVILLTSELDAAGLSNTAWSTAANYSGLGGHFNAYYTNFNSTTANSFTMSSGQVALGINFDDQEVLMYHNGTLINTDTTVDFTKELALNVQQPDTGYNTYDPYINSGQQTYIQTPPAGYKELQTNNLPEPTIKKSSDHFQAIVGEGDNPTSLGANQVAVNSYTNPCGSNPSYNIAQAFDGSTATYFFTPYNVNGLLNPSLVFDTPMTGTTFRVHASLSVAGNLYINGTLKSASNGWVDISTEANGSLKSLGFSASGSASDGFSALEIDGNIVVDLAIKQKAQAAFPNGLHWIKNRVTSSEHQVVDSVGGLTNVLQCPTNGSYTTYSVLTGASVAWCWKADDAWSSTDANVTAGTIASSGRRNVDGGFSIVSYTGTGAVGTVGHALSQKPDFIITKRTNGTDYWVYWHSGIGVDQGYGYLNFALAQQTSATMWTGVSATTWTYDANSNVNHNGGNFISYAWHSVPGYSKFGSYEGSGSTNGAFVYLGFKPKLIMIKNADTSNQWNWFDTSRDPQNDNDEHTITPLSTASETGGYIVDFLSNGFKCRDSSGDTNSASTFIYCAWAEYPFGGENVPPAPAH